MQQNKIPQKSDGSFLGVYTGAQVWRTAVNKKENEKWHV